MTWPLFCAGLVSLDIYSYPFPYKNKKLASRLYRFAPILVVSTGRRSLSAQTEVLVNPEFAGARVAGGGNGKSNDGSKGKQLGRDLLELAEALGDGVASLIFFGNRSHQARGLAEHSHGSGGAHIGESRGRGEAGKPVEVN